MAHSSPSASVMLASCSTTVDSIGTPAPPSDPGNSTDVGASVDQPSACGSETETDIAAADEPPGTTSTDDSESPTCSETDSSGQTWSSEVSDDSWIEDWDMTIHRCSHCERPFVSAARLAQHVQAWHTGSAPVLRPYRQLPLDTGDGSGELEVIVPHGDLFLSVSTSLFCRTTVVPSDLANPLDGIPSVQLHVRTDILLPGGGRSKAVTHHRLSSCGGGPRR